MCDPLTLIGLVGGLAGVLMPRPKPPKVEIPAAEAPVSTTKTAVRIGGDAASKTDAASTEYAGFTEVRKQGKSLGGLGRSGLTI